MKRILRFIIFSFLLCVPFLGHATHIVGGTLNYQYNGGSSYTITLKLFRDCTPGTASFPGSVTITVLGYNGQPFTPSRDITMTLGPVTSVPSNLPPCAQQPNPMPCTQQGIYTTTVNNLPPNPGGYHLYYQLVARNLSLTNVNAAGNNVGESFYAYIPGTSLSWSEDFSLANGTTVDNGTTSWSITNGAATPTTASVNNNLFEVTGANNASVTWSSQVINISSLTAGANLNVNLTEQGTLENSDTIKVYYSLNGSPLIPFATNGVIADDFGNALAAQTGLIGNTVQIFIYVHYGGSSPNSEIYQWDNVIVSANNFISNSNPVFTLFPPLFLCLNTPFTFDHSATDADGDSLVYNFYTPYNGDNNAGPLDPTFTNNAPNFTPIVFLPGYSTTNPLGGAPLSLNSATGLLSGTPSMLGQFVVGILVHEYRNGVLISTTLRDFQFNVVNCPQTLAVTIGPQNPTICFGSTSTTITGNPTGGTPPYTYLWNGTNPTQSINVGVGTYSLTVTDAAGCQVFAFVTVTSFTSSINANAGANQNICLTSPTTTINGTVTAATGGVWSGGSGTYNPNTTTLTNFQYTPTAAEIAAGFVDLYLTTTGNGTCPADVDTVRLNYAPFTGTLATIVTPISCFGGSNGSITANITGGIAPFSYVWNTAPAQTTSTISNLGLGTYTVTVTDGTGCTSQATGTITQPTQLSVTTSVSGVSCLGGSITANPNGGTAPYTYLWQPSGQTTQTASGLPAGTYTVTVRDSRNCIATATTTITPPPPMSVVVNGTNVSCNGGANGSATSTINGGLSPFTYSWSGSGATTPNVTGLSIGSYTLTVTDSRSCVSTATVSITQPTVLAASTTVTNETCDYSDNGTASVTASGGTSPYTYAWSPGGGTTSNISGLSSGTYTVNVTDAKGCIRTAFATITQPNPLSSTFSNQVNVSCIGGNNGAVSVAASGGTGPYTYSWMPGSLSGASVNNLSAGSYTVTYTDSRGCQGQNNVTITQPSQTVSATISAANITCNGFSNGTATAVPVGGTSPYSYVWSAGNQTTQSISNLGTGTYSVTVTDAGGCTASASTTITQPSVILISTTKTNVLCNGGSDGTISSVVSGGTPPYSYLWSPGGATTPNISNLIAGSYTLTVTDFNGCTKTRVVSVAEPQIISISHIKTNETCADLDNGSIILSASGGRPGYTFTTQPGNLIGDTLTGLSSGTYTVSVADTAGCVKTKTVTITQPNPIVISFSNQVNVSCVGGNNGSVSSSISGGTPNFTYLWSPGGSTSSSVSNLSAGTYTLNITDSRGCTAQNTISITEPSAPLSVTPSFIAPSCYGSSNGSMSAVGAGGTAPYLSYTWMPGNLVGQNINNIAAGNYTVTVKDSKNCTANTTVTVTQPSQIIPVLTSDSSTCGNANGSVTAIISGGIGPYTQQWFPAGGTGTTTTPVASGSYTIVVTDNNGCTGSASTNVNDATGPSATIFGTTNVTCFGGSDGTATVNVVGGTGTLTYQWTPTGGNGPVATGLTIGTYTISVTDQNGCQSLASTSPPITQPDDIEIAVTTTDVDCFGNSTGSATGSAIGGTGTLVLTWLPGGTNGANVSGLTAGTYTLQVTDDNLCVKTQTFVINEPSAQLTALLNASPALCFGGSSGSITSNVSGGTSPYQYTWMPGNISGQDISNLPAGTYTLNVTDANNCAASNSITITEPTALTLNMLNTSSTCDSSNATAAALVGGGTPNYSYSWSPFGQVTSSINSMPAGSFTVEVTDANGCTITDSTTIINLPGPVVTVVSTTNITCNGAGNGTATTSVTGGTGTINYVWSPAGGTSSVGTGFTPGVYTVTATDQNGCPSQDVTSFITQPGAITINVLTTNVSCFGGSNGTASAAAGGGTPGFTYTWLPSGSVGSSISGLAAGTYTVRATDSQGCIQDQPFTITEPSAPLAVSISITGVSCFGGNNGTATATVSGGTPAYNYSWLPGTGNNQSYTNLATGNYTVNITDLNGCTTSSSVTVTQPSAALSLSGTNGAAQCFNASDGTASVIASGGTPGYTYQWLPSGGTQNNAVSLSAGNYTVTVTDTNSCTANTTLVISQPTPLSSSVNVTNETCTASNGSIAVQVTGGTSPYSYVWSDGFGNFPTDTGLAAGSYTVQVLDSHNCPATHTVTITDTPGPTVVLWSTTNVSCFGGNNGTASIVVSLGTAPYTVQWLPSGGNPANPTNLPAGSYTASVTDGLGCVNNSVVVTIIEPPILNVSIDSMVPALCNGNANGSIYISPTGGSPAYNYSWTPTGSTQQNITNVQAGNYTVTVTDSLGCSRSISTSITQPAVLTGAIATSTNPVCYGEYGSAEVLVSGGTIPYYYSWNSSPPQTGSILEDILAGTYTCSITDANGCATTSTVGIVQPTQVITTAGPDAIICYGTSGVLNATATGGTGGYMFTWVSPATINNGTLNFTPLVTDSYTVTAYDQDGCEGVPDTVMATVYDLNTSSIDVVGDSLICPGSSAAIFVQVNGNPGPLTYSWNYGLGNGPGAYLVTPSVPTTYIVAVTNPCGSMVRDSITVSFNPPPTIVLNGDTNKICVPDAIQFSDGSISGNINDPISSWTWNFGDGFTSNLQNPSHTYTQPGSYNVTLTVTTVGGCTNNNISAPFNIIGSPYPVASFNINDATLNLPFEQLTCTNTSTNGNTYLWNFGDGATATTYNATHNYSSVGTYNVQLITTTSLGCSDTAFKTIVTETDVVFPNAFTPSTNGPNGGAYNPGELNNNVFFPFTSGVTDFKLQIFNRWGELIFESNDINIGWDGYYRGVLCQQDVYVYKAYLKLNNGKEYNKAGDVTLIQ